mmetsp:Transcript_219/g.489  ORF Transcript_219/g.489 Transcript_219/m.489 type:complete len:320 (-) Transcript_219:105-1064(-)
MGMVKIALVRNPVCLSISGEKRWSLYASGINRAWPEVATLPAIPLVSGRRMSTSPCITTSCGIARERSTRYRVHRDASTSSWLLLDSVKIKELVETEPVCSDLTISRRLAILECALRSLSNMRAFRSTMPTCEAMCSTSNSSDRVNGPVFLLMHCSTATISPLISKTGVQRMESVLYPVLLSNAWEKRLSSYASGTFRVTPFSATNPAMPVPIGMRMFLAPLAMTRTSSLESPSTKYSVDRSQFKRPQVSLIMASAASTGASCAFMFFTAKRNFCMMSHPDSLAFANSAFAEESDSRELDAFLRLGGCLTPSCFASQAC